MIIQLVQALEFNVLQKKNSFLRSYYQNYITKYEGQSYYIKKIVF